MEKKTVVVSDPNGIHLRSAARIVKSCKKFNSRISLAARERQSDPGDRGAASNNADACSIIQLLLLEATGGSEVVITAEGPDEKEACREIAGLFDNPRRHGLS